MDNEYLAQSHFDYIQELIDTDIELLNKQGEFIELTFTDSGGSLFFSQN